MKYALITYYADGTNGVTWYADLKTAETEQKSIIKMLGKGCEAVELIKFESLGVKDYYSYE